MIKLLEKSYKNACCNRVEQWAIDTDAELKDLPKAPPGSSAVSAESGITFYADTSGEWPTDPSKYASPENGGSGGGVTSWNDLQDRPFYADVVGEVATFDGVIEKGLYETPFLGDIPVGETVTVIYDGVEYSCRVSSIFSAEDSSWGKYVGNLNLWGETMPDTGEPFTIVDQYNDSTFNNLQHAFVFGAVFNETTVRISYLEKDIKPIPEEFLNVKGNLIVNIYAEGINEEDMTFINPTADKTVDDIITAVRSGVNVIASITVNGITVFAPFSQLVGQTTMFQMNYCMADVPSIMGVTIEIDGDTNAIIAGFHEIQFSN